MRARPATFAPILISFSSSVVSDQSLIGSGGGRRAQKIAEVAGERVKLKAKDVAGEGAARHPRPFDRALALLDPLFAGSALVVESDDVLGGAAYVGHDEADVRIAVCLSAPRPQKRQLIARYQYGICARPSILIYRLLFFNRLNYCAKMVEPDGIEPTTSSMPLRGTRYPPMSRFVAICL